MKTSALLLRSSSARAVALCLALGCSSACIVREPADAGNSELESPTRAEPRPEAGVVEPAPMGGGGAGGKGGAAAGAGGKAGTPAADGGHGGSAASGTAAECTACIQRHPMCNQSWLGCQHLEGRAENGPEKGQLKSGLCVAMVECFRRTRCGAGSDARVVDFTQCYCGASTDACLSDASQPANGACAAEIAAAVELREPIDVKVNLTTPKYASGAAYDVLNKCDAVACAPFCGATCKRDSTSKLCSKKSGGLGCAADLDADAGVPVCDYTDPPPVLPVAGAGGSSARAAGSGANAAGSGGAIGAGSAGAAGAFAGAGGA